MHLLAQIGRGDPAASQAMLISWINRGFGSFIQLDPAPHKVLLLGLGGGTLAHLVLLISPETMLDAVEWSAPVIQVARDHFGLDQALYGDRISLHQAEASAFLQQCIQENEAASEGEVVWGWDAIIVDLYSNDDLPEQCVTREFLSLCWCLTSASPNGGRVAYNCGRELDVYPTLAEAAMSLASDTCHVAVIHPEEAVKDTDEDEDKDKDEEECMVDNALVLFINPATLDEAAAQVEQVRNAAGDY